MKRELRLQGKTNEEKLASVELILQRMNSKLSTKVIGILPVSPIFDFVSFPESDGTVLKRMFPAEGSITKACYYFGTKGKEPVDLIFTVMNPIKKSSSTTTFTVKKPADVINLDFAVTSGDILTISLSSETPVEGIWFAMLYEVAYKELRGKEFLIEELENMIVEE